MRKNQDIIGRRFQRLVVLEETDKDKNGNRKFICRCDCGNEKAIYKNSLTSGVTVSCGCYNKEIASNLMSKGFAKIFTKDFIKKEHFENNKSLRQIAKEKNSSLGCLIRYLKKFGIEAKDNKHHLEGRRFEKLLVTSFSYIKYSTSYWKCVCDCGNETVVPAGSLLRGRTQSCGCYNREKDYQGIGNLSKTYWSRAMSGAKSRDLSFEIDIDFGWELFLKQDGKCALTGKPITLVRGYKQSLIDRTKPQQTASLDRIDSTKGYTKDNVQWVKLKINRMKWDLDQQEFINMCKEVVEHNK